MQSFVTTFNSYECPLTYLIEDDVLAKTIGMSGMYVRKVTRWREICLTVYANEYVCFRLGWSRL